MKKMNPSVKSVIVLVAICLVVTSALAGINFVTGPIIKEKQDAIKFGAMYEVLPNATGFEDVKLPEGAPETVTSIGREISGNGYAMSIVTSSRFSKSDMTFIIGLDNDLNITAIKLTNYGDSKDFGADYPNQYVGVNGSTVADVATVSGVTFSSKAFKGAVTDAFTALDLALKEGN